MGADKAVAPFKEEGTAVDGADVVVVVAVAAAPAKEALTAAHAKTHPKVNDAAKKRHQW